MEQVLSCVLMFLKTYTLSTSLLAHSPQKLQVVRIYNQMRAFTCHSMMLLALCGLTETFCPDLMSDKHF